MGKNKEGGGHQEPDSWASRLIAGHNGAVYFRKFPRCLPSERVSVLELFKPWEVKPK
jgi:hypothetical protein